IPAADAHRLLGEHGAFLLDRAFSCWRGAFTFHKEAAPPAGSFPLGSRWGLLMDSVRRLEVPLLRARLGKRLTRPVVRSGGLGVGKVEELGLNAQETRIYAAIDGTKTVEEVLQAHDAGMTLRLLYLLTELGHLAFAEVADEVEAPPPAAKAVPPAEPVIPPPPQPAKAAAAPPPPQTAKAAAAPPPPQPAKAAAAPPPPAPKINRQPPRAAPKRAAPPVMKAVSPPAPAKPAAPALSRPPPTFAQGPANESAEAMLKRLSALWERLSQLNHFEALGLERKSATPAEAKRNFFVLAKELHPDTVTDAEQAALTEMKERLFARINEAAQVIGDEKRRKEYEG